MKNIALILFVASCTVSDPCDSGEVSNIAVTKDCQADYMLGDHPVIEENIYHEAHADDAGNPVILMSEADYYKLMSQVHSANNWMRRAGFLLK